MQCIVDLVDILCKRRSTAWLWISSKVLFSAQSGPLVKSCIPRDENLFKYLEVSLGVVHRFDWVLNKLFYPLLEQSCSIESRCAVDMDGLCSEERSCTALRLRRTESIHQYFYSIKVQDCCDTFRKIVITLPSHYEFD